MVIIHLGAICLEQPNKRVFLLLFRKVAVRLGNMIVIGIGNVLNCCSFYEELQKDCLKDALQMLLKHEILLLPLRAFITS